MCCATVSGKGNTVSLPIASFVASVERMCMQSTHITNALSFIICNRKSNRKWLFYLWSDRICETMRQSLIRNPWHTTMNPCGWVGDWAKPQRNGIKIVYESIHFILICMAVAIYLCQYIFYWADSPYSLPIKPFLMLESDLTNVQIHKLIIVAAQIYIAYHVLVLSLTFVYPGRSVFGVISKTVLTILL